MKRALITGITGMVGSHLLDYLVDNTNWEIHGILRWRSSLENITKHIPMINESARIFLHYTIYLISHHLRIYARDSI